MILWGIREIFYQSSGMGGGTSMIDSRAFLAVSFRTYE